MRRDTYEKNKLVYWYEGNLKGRKMILVLGLNKLVQCLWLGPLLPIPLGFAVRIVFATAKEAEAHDHHCRVLRCLWCWPAGCRTWFWVGHEGNGWNTRLVCMRYVLYMFFTATVSEPVAFLIFIPLARWSGSHREGWKLGRRKQGLENDQLSRDG